MARILSRLQELQTLKRENGQLKSELATEKDKVVKAQTEIKRLKELLAEKNQTIKEFRDQPSMTFQQKRCALLEKHPLKIKSLSATQTPQRKKAATKSSTKISNVIGNPVEDSQSSNAQRKHYNLRSMRKSQIQDEVPQELTKVNAQTTSGKRAQKVSEKVQNKSGERPCKKKRQTASASIGGTGSTSTISRFPNSLKTEPGTSSMNGVTLHKQLYSKATRNKFACICGFTAAAKRNLANHLKYYNTETNFECLIKGCREKFNAASRLKQHMRVQHKRKFPYYGCRNYGCGALFKNWNLMLSHCRTVHKQICELIDMTNEGGEVTPPSTANGVELPIEIPLRAFFSPVPPRTTAAAGPSFAAPISSIPASGMDMRQENSGDCLEASSSGLTEQDGVDPESSRNVLKVETEVTPSTSAAMWPVKVEGEVYGMYKPCHF